MNPQNPNSISIENLNQLTEVRNPIENTNLLSFYLKNNNTNNINNQVSSSSSSSSSAASSMLSLNGALSLKIPSSNNHLDHRDSVDKLHELNLHSRIKYLEEELANAQADKEFVWSLWRQLQLTNPDLTNAISSVVQREKEKAEQKDKKVLKILESKDAKIQELQKLVLDKQNELTDLNETVRKLELKLTTSNDEITYMKFNMKNIEEENQFFEKMLKTTKEEQARSSLNNENEKQNLISKISELNSIIEQLRNKENQFIMDSQDYKLNTNILNNQIKMANDNYEKLFSDLTKLNVSMEQIRNDNKKLNEENSLVNEKNANLRHELNDLFAKFNSNVEYLNEQCKMIEQLKSIQMELQESLRNYKSENEELRNILEQYKLKYQTKETECEHLRKKFEELELINKLDSKENSQYHKRKLKHNRNNIDYDQQVTKLRSKSCDNRNKTSSKSSSLIENEYYSDNEDNYTKFDDTEDINNSKISKVKLFYENISKEKDVHLKVLQEAYERRLERLVHLEKQNKMLKLELKRNQSKSGDLVSYELELLHKENNKLLEDNFKMKQLCQSNQDELDKLNKKLIEFNNNNIILEKKKIAKKAKKKSMKDGGFLVKLNKKLEHIKRKNDSLESTQKTLRDKLDAAIKSKITHESKIKQLKLQCECLLKEIAQFKNRENDLKLKEDEMARTKSDEQIISELKKSYESKIKQLNQELSKQNTNNKALKVDIDNLSQKLKLNEEKYNHVERDVAQKKQLIEFYKKKLDEFNLKEKNEANTKIDEIVDTTKMKKLNESNQKYLTELNLLKAKQKTIEMEKFNLEKTISQLEKTNAEHLSRIEMLKKDNTHLHSNIKQLKSTSNELEDYINKLEKTAQTKMENLSEMSQQTLSIAKSRLNLAYKSLDHYKCLIKYFYEIILKKYFELKKSIDFEREKLVRKTSSGNENGDQNMKKAMDLASSILNLTFDELDDLIDVKIDNGNSGSVNYETMLTNMMNEFEKIFSTTADYVGNNNMNNLDETSMLKQYEKMANELKKVIGDLVAKRLNQIIDLESELICLKPN